MYWLPRSPRLAQAVNWFLYRCRLRQRQSEFSRPRVAYCQHARKAECSRSSAGTPLLWRTKQRSYLNGGFFVFHRESLGSVHPDWFPTNYFQALIFCPLLKTLVRPALSRPGRHLYAMFLAAEVVGDIPEVGTRRAGPAVALAAL